MPPLAYPDPVLRDGAISLRAPSARDAAAITAACQDGHIQRWTLVPAPYARADAEDWIASVAASAAAGTALELLVTAGEDELLGAVGLVAIDWARGTAEVGFWLAAEARGRGVMTRAVLLLRDWSAQALGLAELELLAHADNHPSRRVAERAGFAETGERVPVPRRPGAAARDHLRYVWPAPSRA